jgi:hypothetical protein
METNTSQTKGRCLVVADQALRGDQVRDRLLQELGGEPTEVFVVAPALVDSALEHHMGDVDSARGPAQERLDETLEELRAAGLNAEGEVGDSDPLLAISDEVAKFNPDRIFVIARPEGEELYAEHNLMSRLERDFGERITELVVEGSGSDQHVVDVEQTDPVPDRAKGDRPTGNLPPLTKRDILGLVVALVGTLAIGALAAAGAAQDQSGFLEEGRLDGLGPAMLLIALFTALINLAHMVGLIFFQSVRYKGPFEKLFSRLSLYGTPVVLLLMVAFYIGRA